MVEPLGIESGVISIELGFARERVVPVLQEIFAAEDRLMPSILCNDGKRGFVPVNVKRLIEYVDAGDEIGIRFALEVYNKISGNTDMIEDELYRRITYTREGRDKAWIATPFARVTGISLFVASLALAAMNGGKDEFVGRAETFVDTALSAGAFSDSANASASSKDFYVQIELSKKPERLDPAPKIVQLIEDFFAGKKVKYNGVAVKDVQEVGERKSDTGEAVGVEYKVDLENGDAFFVVFPD